MRDDPVPASQRHGGAERRLCRTTNWNEWRIRSLVGLRLHGSKIPSDGRADTTAGQGYRNATDASEMLWPTVDMRAPSQGFHFEVANKVSFGILKQQLAVAGMRAGQLAAAGTRDQTSWRYFPRWVPRDVSTVVRCWSSTTPYCVCYRFAQDTRHRHPVLWADA